MSFARVSFLVVTAVSMAGAAAACGPEDTSPEVRLLQRMTHAEMELTYSGTRVIFENLEGRSDRHVELVLRSAARTRVEFPKGSPRYGEVVVENPNERQHWVPKKDTVYVGHPRRPKRYGEQMERVIRGVEGGRLQLRNLGATRVAGRAATVLALYRQGSELVWKMSIDDDSGILLKQEIMDRANPRRVIGGFEYTQVDLKAKARAQDFVIRRPNARIVKDEFVSVEQAQKSVAFRILIPTHLPSGYMLVGAKPARFGESDGVQLLYQDRPSVAPISIFEVAGRMPRRDRHNSPTREFSFASRQVGDVFASVMGKLPQSELQAVADSLR